LAINLEERETAGKRISIQTLWNGKWENVDGLENMIQVMADRGFNFAGLVDEILPGSMVTLHTMDYLFIKAAE